MLSISKVSTSRGPTLTPAAAPITLGTWPTYAQATTDLQTFATQYPTLTKLVSIGKTVQNRDIWAMEITDNPGVNEDEPEFYYQGQIHGDEPIGMENSFYLINDLLTNYGSNARLTNLVNNMDIWIVPSMNWDGYSMASPTVAHRENANGVDLNRNFPEWTNRSFSSDTKYFGNYGNQYDGPTPTTSALQPETVATMNFLRAHHFVASANFHSGDLVVNYPWDTDGSAGANYAYSPNDALFKQMALIYSVQNAPMYANNTSPFVHGTTNGDNWYPVSGGEQDWANIYTGDHQFTIELDSSEKYPVASKLPTLWANNHESMLQFMEAANWGVRGLVTDSSTGLPLNAKVTVIAPAPAHTADPNHPATLPVFTDPTVGDYHEQLLPGTYTIKFEAAGYVTQTISNVVVSSTTNDPTLTARMNVQMVAVDSTPPTIVGAAFNFNSSPQQTLSFTFSEAVQGVDNSDLTLTDNTHATTIASSNIVLDSYNAATHVATFKFSYAGGTLPGASYTASIKSAGVSDLAGNALASGYAYNFLDAAGTSANDTIYAKRNGALLQVWQNADPQTASPTYSATYSTLSNFSIDGSTGDDTLTLDFTGGEVRPAGANGFGYQLGNGNETLALRGPINWNFAIDPAIATPSLSLVLDTGAGATFGASITHLAALVLDTNATASLTAGSDRLLITGALTIGGGGALLDLNDNDLIVDYASTSPLASIGSYVALARDGGDWIGSGGLTSTAAKNNALHNTSLAVVESTEYKSVATGNTLFDGVAVDDSAVLVKYTFNGDADLNGRVNADDYGHIDSGYQNQHADGFVADWFHGNFDYNTIINADDYALIDAAYQTQNSL